MTITQFTILKVGRLTVTYLRYIIYLNEFISIMNQNCLCNLKI